MRLANIAMAAGMLCVVSACGGQPAAQHSAGAPSPSAAASPTPVSAPLRVSDATPVIFFRDGANFDQIDGMTWNGVVGAAPGTPDYHTGNPSMTLFGSMTDIRDRHGAVATRGQFGAKSFAATWADDDVHYCLMKPFDFTGADGVPATLEVGSVEGGMSAVAQVGRVYEQAAIYVVGCSFAGDRAVVVQSGGQGIGVTQYWVVQLSTGKVVWAHSFAGLLAPISVVASHDATYVVENFDAGPGLQTSTVYTGSGVEVKQLDGGVAAISWGGTAVVLTSRSGGQPSAVATLESGGIIWTAPAVAGDYVMQAMAEPQGRRLAIGIANSKTSYSSSTWKGLPIVDLYVIDADGATVTTLRGVYW